MTFKGSIAEQLEATHGRPSGFDVLRLVAASAVVFHHSFGVEHDLVHDDILFRNTGGAVHFGILSVDIFFVVSGFLLTLSALRTNSLPVFVLRRFSRIFPGLIVVVAISTFILGPMLTNLSIKDYFGNSQTYVYLLNIFTIFRRYLPGIYDVHGIPIVFGGSMWTLQNEILSYLILSAAIMMGRVTIVGIATTFTIMLAIYVVGAEGLVDIPGRVTIFAALASYFFAGALIAICRDWVKVSPVILLAVVALIISTSQLHIFMYLLVFYIAYLSIAFGAFGPGLPSFMDDIDLSYGIYLWHCPLLTIYLSQRFWLPWPVLALVLLSGSAIIAFVSWELIESRSIRWAHSFGRRFNRVG